MILVYNVSGINFCIVNSFVFHYFIRLSSIQTSPNYTTIVNNSNPVEIHIGLNTHIHDQVICPVSFNPINNIVNNPTNPIRIPSLFVCSLLMSAILPHLLKLVNKKIGGDLYHINLPQSHYYVTISQLLSFNKNLLLIHLKLNSLSSPRITIPSLSVLLFNTLFPSAIFNNSSHPPNSML